MEQRIEDMDAQLRAAQRDLDEAKAAQAQSQGREQRRQVDMEEEVRRLKRRCEQLEAERDSAQEVGVRTPSSEFEIEFEISITGERRRDGRIERGYAEPAGRTNGPLGT